jgi:hypothetical protein
MDLVYFAAVNMRMFVTASPICYVFYALPELYNMCLCLIFKAIGNLLFQQRRAYELPFFGDTIRAES